LIVASTNGVMEMEAFRMLPEGVSAHFTRIPYAGTGTEDAENRMLATLEATSRLLAGSSETIGVDVIGLAHGSGTSFGGTAFARTLEAKMSTASGVPALTMSTAVVRGLQKLGVKRVAAVSPFYQTRMLEKFKAFLEEQGFEVKAYRNLDLNQHHLVSRQPPSIAYELLKSVDGEGVEALVLNNPNIRTIDVIETVEQDLGKAVVTGSQALIWACLRTIGVQASLSGFGRLFRM